MKFLRQVHEIVCQTEEGCRGGGGGQTNHECIGSNTGFQYVDHL
jgi:hypothetical protein